MHLRTLDARFWLSLDLRLLKPTPKALSFLAGARVSTSSSWQTRCSTLSHVRSL